MTGLHHRYGWHRNAHPTPRSTLSCLLTECRADIGGAEAAAQCLRLRPDGAINAAGILQDAAASNIRPSQLRALAAPKGAACGTVFEVGE